MGRFRRISAAAHADSESPPSARRSLQGTAAALRKQRSTGPGISYTLTASWPCLWGTTPRWCASAAQPARGVLSVLAVYAAHTGAGRFGAGTTTRPLAWWSLAESQCRSHCAQAGGHVGTTAMNEGHALDLIALRWRGVGSVACLIFILFS